MKRYLKIVTLLVAPVLFLFSCSGQWENDSQGEQSYDSSENQSYTSNSSNEDVFF